MTRALRKGRGGLVGALLFAVLVAGGGAATRWPHLQVVETGKTPEYPDLRPRTYAAPPAAVAKAAEEAVGRLPGWRFAGAGHGAGGTALQAVHRSPVLGIEEDVDVRIHPGRGGSVVVVRSRSRDLPWDFGQNARNIRALLAELDRALS